MMRIGDAFSESYGSKLEELHEKLRRAKESLRDSINFGTWKRAIYAGELTILVCVICA